MHVGHQRVFCEHYVMLAHPEGVHVSRAVPSAFDTMVNMVPRSGRHS
jgi:hypothetical protein